MDNQTQHYDRNLWDLSKIGEASPPEPESDKAKAPPKAKAKAEGQASQDRFLLGEREITTKQTQNEASTSKEEEKLRVPFFDHCFDKNRLKKWITKIYYETIVTEDLTILNFVETLKNIGFQEATRAGVSIGIDDLRIPPAKMDLVKQIEYEVEQTNREFSMNQLTALENFQSFIDTWHRTSETIKMEVVANFEETDTLNPVYMMAFSGARGNLSQVSQLVGMRGFMSDPEGQIIDYPIRSNFREGLTLTEYVISCYGARKGLVDTALRTADAGYLTRRLVDVAHSVVITKFDCKTTQGIWLTAIKEGSKTVYPLEKRLVGRVLADNVYYSPFPYKYEEIEINEDTLIDPYGNWNSDFYAGLEPNTETARDTKTGFMRSKQNSETLNSQSECMRDENEDVDIKTDQVTKEKPFPESLVNVDIGTEINEDTEVETNEDTETQPKTFVWRGFLRNQQLDSARAKLLSACFTRVFVRSPLRCLKKQRLCQLCYGWTLPHAHLAPIGEAVGILAAQSIGEPGTQLTMRTFHTGGVFSGALSEDLKAPYSGRICYSKALRGALFRASNGQLAFRTKEPGRFTLKPLTTNQLHEGKTFSGKDPLRGFGDTIFELDFPAASILFLKNFETVSKGGLLIELPKEHEAGKETVLNTYTYYSKRSGLLKIYKTALGPETNKDIICHPKVPQIEPFYERAQYNGPKFHSFKIYAGQIIKTLQVKNILPQPGDLINTYSLMNRTQFVYPISTTLQTANSGCTCTSTVTDKINPISRESFLGCPTPPLPLTVQKSIFNTPLIKIRYSKTFGYISNFPQLQSGLGIKLILPNLSSKTQPFNAQLSIYLKQVRPVACGKLIYPLIFSKLYLTDLFVGDEKQVYRNQYHYLGGSGRVTHENENENFVVEAKVKVDVRITAFQINDLLKFKSKHQGRGGKTFPGELAGNLAGELALAGKLPSLALDQAFFEIPEPIYQNFRAYPKRSIKSRRSSKRNKQSQGKLLSGYKCQFRNKVTQTKQIQMNEPFPSLYGGSSIPNWVQKEATLCKQHNLQRKTRAAVAKKDGFLIKKCLHNRHQLSLTRKWKKLPGKFYWQTQSKYQFKVGWPLFQPYKPINVNQHNQFQFFGQSVSSNISFPNKCTYTEYMQQPRCPRYALKRLQTCNIYLTRTNISFKLPKQTSLILLIRPAIQRSLIQGITTKQTQAYQKTFYKDAIFEEIKRFHKLLLNNVLTVNFTKPFQGSFVSARRKNASLPFAYNALNQLFTQLNKQSNTVTNVNLLSQQRSCLQIKTFFKNIPLLDNNVLAAFLGKNTHLTQNSQALLYQHTYRQSVNLMQFTLTLSPNRHFNSITRSLTTNSVFMRNYEYGLTHSLQTQNYFKTDLHLHKNNVDETGLYALKPLLTLGSNNRLQIPVNSPIIQSHFLSNYSGEVVVTKNLNEVNSLVLTSKDTCTIKSDFLSRKCQIGDSICYGMEVTQSQSAPQAGQVIQVTKTHIKLQLVENLLIASNSRFFCQDNQFIEKTTQLFSQSYPRLQMGDIVQGIPKIEEFFEARRTKEGNFMKNNLSSRLSKRFLFYFDKCGYPTVICARKSIYDIQNYIIESIFKLYNSQGIDLSDKHLEIIVRQMTSRVKVNAYWRVGCQWVPPKHPLPAEFYSRQYLERFLYRRSHNPPDIYFVFYVPMVLGITRAALKSDGFISAASFQETTRMLSRGAIFQKKDYLKGLKENVILGHIIPAGTAVRTYSRRFQPPAMKQVLAQQALQVLTINYEWKLGVVDPTTVSTQYFNSMRNEILRLICLEYFHVI